LCTVIIKCSYKFRVQYSLKSDKFQPADDEKFEFIFDKFHIDSSLSRGVEGEGGGGDDNEHEDEEEDDDNGDDDDGDVLFPAFPQTKFK
jgi:hypothetical protein